MLTYIYFLLGHILHYKPNDHISYVPETKPFSIRTSSPKFRNPRWNGKWRNRKQWNLLQAAVVNWTWCCEEIRLLSWSVWQLGQYQQDERQTHRFNLFISERLAYLVNKVSLFILMYCYQKLFGNWVSINNTEAESCFLHFREISAFIEKLGYSFFCVFDA